MKFLLIVLGFFSVLTLFFLYQQKSKTITNLKDITKLLIELDKNSNVYFENPNNAIKSDARNKIISLRPWMEKYIYIRRWELTYDQDIESFNDSLIAYFSDIRIAYDKVKFQNAQPISLSKAILQSFLFPSTVLGWFGLDLNLVASKIFSLLTYLVTFAIHEFGSDIALFVVNLFK